MKALMYNLPLLSGDNIVINSVNCDADINLFVCFVTCTPTSSLKCSRLYKKIIEVRFARDFVIFYSSEKEIFILL